MAGALSFRAVLPTVPLALLLLLWLSPAVLGARDESAKSLYNQGRAAETREDYDTAFDDYQKAVAKNPKEEHYKIALNRVRVTAAAAHIDKGRKLLKAGNTAAALAEFLHAAEIDPSNEAAQQQIALTRQKQGELVQPSESGIPKPAGTEAQLQSIGGPPELKPLSNEPLTLHMTEDAKVIYQAIGKAAGINVLFDPDYNSKRVQVDLNNVSLLDSLRIVGTMTNTFWRPITSNAIFVAQNTRAKRTELDEQAVQTFYLTNAWQQNDLNDVQTALRNVLPSAKVYGVASQNAIVMRGTSDELLLAEKLIDDLDKPRSEVVVDVAVMEVSRNWQRNLGISWPSSIGMSLQSGSSSSSSTTTGTTTTATSPTLYDLAHLKASDFAVTVGSATLNLLLSDSNTKVLQNPRIRATDAQKATMKIGSKIPIATGSYQTGASTALVSSLVNTQFQYEDVGVNIEMTPTVHYDHDVTLKLKIEVSAQSGSVTISGVTEPILSQRVVDQVIRLREGEASILGGIENNQDQISWTGIPGLSTIPILKYLFGSKDRTYQNDEIVFVVVPHIVRSHELDEQNLRAIDTGAGTSIDLRRSDGAGRAPAASTPAASTPQPSARPSATRPDVGVVPGESAEAAAPAAMAQLNRAANDAASGTGSAAQPFRPPAAAASASPQPAPPTASSPAAGMSFVLSPPATPVPTGSSFQVPITLDNGTDVWMVPLQLHYDPAHLALVNVASGALLSSDGQAATPVHRDDSSGNLNVAISRPAGAAGVNGSGVVCILTFQAKATGSSTLSITQGGTVDSKQKQVAAPVTQADIVVR
jgi:general secretion pathway protein D